MCTSENQVYHLCVGSGTGASAEFALFKRRRPTWDRRNRLHISELQRKRGYYQSSGRLYRRRHVSQLILANVVCRSNQ